MTWEMIIWGAVVVKQETIISHIISRELPPVLDPKVGHEDAIAAATENSWKADSDGSLICGDNWWHLCSEQANKKILSIGKNYFCCDKGWQDKACN